MACPEEEAWDVEVWIWAEGAAVCVEVDHVDSTAVTTVLEPSEAADFKPMPAKILKNSPINLI